MKRYMCLFLSVLLLVLSGCSQIELPSGEEIVGNIASEAFHAASDQISSDIENAVDSLTPSLPQSGSGNASTCTIFYDAAGGYNAPATQTFKRNSCPKLSSQTPQRPGYHFMGWTRVNGDNEPRFFAKTKSYQTLTQDTTFYAVWASEEDRLSCELDLSHSAFASQWSDHKCKVSQSGTSVAVSCACCGLQITDRSLNLDTFTYYCTGTTSYEALSAQKQSDVWKKFVLFKAQEYGPAYLQMAQSVYLKDSGETDYNALMDPIENALNTLDVLVQVNQSIEVSSASSKYELNQIRYAYKDISKSVESASNGISIVKAACYFAEMTAPDTTATDALNDLLDTVDAITAIAPDSFYPGPLKDVLQTGADLWTKCIEYELVLYENILSLPDRHSQDLEDLLGMQYMSAIDRSRNGAFFDTDPTAYELMVMLNAVQPDGRTKYASLDPLDQPCVTYYLLGRIEYEFGVLTGVPFDDYVRICQEEVTFWDRILNFF